MERQTELLDTAVEQFDLESEVDQLDMFILFFDDLKDIDDEEEEICAFDCFS